MDKQKLWNDGYVTLPELGSGPGSRGYAARFKQKLIEDALATHHRDQTVYEVVPSS